MSDIEGKVAREAMSECGQRASFNPFGVQRVKRRGRHAPLRRCRFWNAFKLRSGIRARIASVLRLPFQQTTHLVEKLRAQEIAFEAIATVSAQHPAIRRFKNPNREAKMSANVTL
jgi:hypothetical protein